MNQRTLRRQAMKAQGVPLRNGPAKGSTGKEKGPARTPTLLEARRMARAALRAAAAEEQKTS